MANEVSGSRLLPASVRGTHINGHAEIARAAMAQRVLAVQNVPLHYARVWDARQTNLPGTAAADDLAYITGTLGTNMPLIQSSDGKATTITQYAGFEIPIPDDYEDGETFTIRLTAGMTTTVSDTTATIDVQAYLSNDDGTTGSDICATAAQSINSLTPAEFNFTITPTTLGAGGRLNVRIAIAITDGATGTVVKGSLYAVKVLSDRR